MTFLIFDREKCIEGKFIIKLSKYKVIIRLNKHNRDVPYNII